MLQCKEFWTISSIVIKFSIGGMLWQWCWLYQDQNLSNIDKIPHSTTDLTLTLPLGINWFYSILSDVLNQWHPCLTPITA